MMASPLAVLVLLLLFVCQIQAWFDWQGAKIPAVEVVLVMDGTAPSIGGNNGPTNDFNSVVKALKHPSTIRDVQTLFSDSVFIEDLKRVGSDPTLAAAFLSATEMFSDPDQAVRLFTTLHEKFRDVKRMINADRLTDLRELLKDPQALGGVWDTLRDLDTAKKEVRSSAQLANT